MADWLVNHFYAILAVLFLGAWLLSQSFFILEPEGRALVVRLMVVREWLIPGLSFLIPFFDRVARLPASKYPKDYPAGRTGRIVSVIGSSGYVRLDGERWMWLATGADSPLKKDSKVRVVSRDGVTLQCKEVRWL
ncbi:MAG: NfeD family protein [bacterium]